VLKRRFLKSLPRHRKHPLVRKIDHLCMRFHHAFENLNYDFAENGEFDVLRKVASQPDVKTVFDVGANVGAWSRMATDVLPGATIHSFEIVPETFRQMRENCAASERIVPHGVGLSDAPGEVDVFYATGRSEIATCVSGISESIHKYSPPTVRAEVTTGDIFCAARGIERIDFLKLDVEGFEPNVLRGFGGMLGSGAIKVIQFEYGYGNLLSRFLLKDFYELLRPRDMRIGKIFPGAVEFRDYDLHDEDFIGPNFLAVHASMGPLLKALEG
jgi:FkbM family methyltransferase